MRSKSEKWKVKPLELKRESGFKVAKFEPNFRTSYYM